MLRENYMFIKNRKELATTELRKYAIKIIEAGINSVLPVNLMHSAVKYDAKRKILIVQKKKYKIGQGRIFVIGGGKAAGLMAKELENIVGYGNITAGIVNCKSSCDKTKKIKVIKASHPVPDQNGVRGVNQILALKKKYSINKNDFIICLISGGASSLMPCPVNGVSLKDTQNVTKLLLISGAKIQEINAIRKHLSKIKGGKLGKFFVPTRMVSIIMSDVVGNDLKTIASGPTVPDPSTFEDACNVLKKYKLLSKAPKTVVKYLERGLLGEARETAKALSNCFNHVICKNKTALAAMADMACRLNLKPIIITAEQVGDPVKMADIRAKEIINGEYKGYNAIIIGGETTPKLPKNHGKGGRNQHFMARSILAMKKYSGGWAAASIGIDGSDFLPDAAGAIIDNNTLNSAKDKGIDIKKYLKKYDSNTLFKKISGSLIVTGDTGTNVGDVMVYVLA